MTGHASGVAPVIEPDDLDEVINALAMLNERVG